MKKNKNTPYSIHNLPPEDRPRERFLKLGAEAMTTAEILAIILGSGTKEFSVLQLAQEIMMRFGSLQNLSKATVKELSEIKGLGLAKALQLKAAFALGQRLLDQPLQPKYKITHPIHAYHFIRRQLEQEQKELFVIIMQDTKGCVIAHEVVSMGTLSHTLVDPREVFNPAVRHRASSVVLVHNHPSGDPEPSTEDYKTTEALIKAGTMMGISVTDHLIIGERKYVSLRQKGFSFA